MAALVARCAHAQEVPAGTPIEIEIRDALGSAQSQRGDKFAIAVHAPVYVGEQLVIPAGTPGVGEVVHAERARGGGKPGELILAARWLELDGRRIALRGMKLGITGVDKSGKAIGLATIPIVGLFTYVRGGETHVPQGALAGAKIAETFDASTAPSTAIAPSPASIPAPESAPSLVPAPTPAPVQDAAVVPSSNNAVSKE
ncbi:hypothetical protein LK996_15390 [Lysobacter sp. A6]|uniref:Uncharacterized protein n=1 Tax=Noviluteimonas lactosilytica TaxID=2888523 RepID=A0ABS8JLV2_9GAMM|nr:hypothetical protein [Lysobacter lactosilyticus]MCC8364455.1 hypothetical protein [Lysobacter lactosilyticus]